METVKRKDGPRYRESYYLGNKKINGPYFRRITDAKNWKFRMESDKSRHLSLGPQPLTLPDISFKAFADKWLENHVQTNCSPKTFLNYESVLRIHVYPRFGNVLLKQLSESHGIELMQMLKQKHQGKGAKNIWLILKSAIRAAMRSKLLPSDPFLSIRTPKEELRVDSFWLRAEVDQFLQANALDELYPLYFVGVHTGMRMAELCGLKWDRVHFNRNLISVTRTRDKDGLKETTKTKLKREIPMTQEVKALLLGLYKNNATISDYVLLNRNLNPVDYSHLYRDFKKAQKKARMSNLIRFHDLRHTFASNFVMNGGQIYELQKLLGHTDMKMTLRYAHLTPDHLQSSIPYMQMTDSRMDIPILDLRAKRAL